MRAVNFSNQRIMPRKDVKKEKGCPALFGQPFFLWVCDFADRR
jgi:hypothetical protein